MLASEETQASLGESWAALRSVSTAGVFQIDIAPFQNPSERVFAESSGEAQDSRSISERFFGIHAHAHAAEWPRNSSTSCRNPLPEVARDVQSFVGLDAAAATTGEENQDQDQDCQLTAAKFTGPIDVLAKFVDGIASHVASFKGTRQGRSPLVLTQNHATSKRRPRPRPQPSQAFGSAYSELQSFFGP